MEELSLPFCENLQSKSAHRNYFNLRSASRNLNGYLCVIKGRILSSDDGKVLMFGCFCDSAVISLFVAPMLEIRTNAEEPIASFVQAKW